LHFINNSLRLRKLILNFIIRIESQLLLVEEGDAPTVYFLFSAVEWEKVAGSYIIYWPLSLAKWELWWISANSVEYQAKGGKGACH
jgi:hypothetical protein